MESFREVVIDFDGIGWICQCFARQFFVLFAKEHPGVKLIPENMYESVTKMYNHVILGAVNA